MGVDMYCVWMDGYEWLTGRVYHSNNNRERTVQRDTHCYCKDDGTDDDIL